MTPTDRKKIRKQQQSVHLRCLELFRLARWASCGSYSPEGQQQEEPLIYNSLVSRSPDDKQRTSHGSKLNAPFSSVLEAVAGLDRLLYLQRHEHPMCVCASEAKKRRQIALAEPTGCTHLRRTIAGVVAQDTACDLALLLLQLHDAVLDGVSNREAQHAHVLLLADAVHAVAGLVLGKWVPPRLAPARRGKMGTSWGREDGRIGRVRP
eukprot:scaffold7804_cov65-Phaeocystis_antarctica.AAC.3